MRAPHNDAPETMLDSNMQDSTSADQTSRPIPQSLADENEMRIRYQISPVTQSAAQARSELEKLCLPQDFQDLVEVQQIQTCASLCKPGKGWFFRVHPTYSRYIALLEENGDLYVLAPDLIPLLGSEVMKRLIVPAINRQGKVFFWPVKVPDERELDPWSKSALAGMQSGKTKWTKLVSNHSLQRYDVFAAKCDLGEPEWPDGDMTTLFMLSIKERIIASIEHPVVKRLRGEI